jgi:hypothetical protein
LVRQKADAMTFSSTVSRASGDDLKVRARPLRQTTCGFSPSMRSP